MIRVLHPIAGVTGLLCIATFWFSTVATEALGDAAAILAVKTMILWGLLLLVPAMAVAGATGWRMAGRATAPRIASKRRRMPFIALNGLLVLVPCAFFLQARAAEGDFGEAFFLVQGIELLAGATNLTLMGLNMRDGFALAKRFARA
ncbi:conserved membrane protein of unknown function [Rhodovastum atsumiense]|uniref:DUF2269 family protein n=1 Tax=Rhodovastum atsumiense TaxID=504468 RepID=A0A5M6INE3_9PROT|nr:hypothetical protein [Rhodovastum atsumiense]KAA5609780.1 hypothetical protein F1189_22575 [Rhodovastum atsumiense]CAH2599439.1 conserved membrane protein of unknown function [Rhodovastum atsumiense]